MARADAAVRQPSARSVAATLRYLAESSSCNRLYVAPGAEMATGVYDEHVVAVSDARGSAFHLDEHGFALVDHHSAVADFHDRAEVDRVYVPEVVAAVQRLLGADLVVPMGWVLRRAAASTAGAQPAAADVHVDVHPDRAPERFRRVYEEARPGAAPFRRAIFTSFWRAISPPPQDWPLALCDYRSLRDDEGIPNLMVRVDALPDQVPATIEGEDQLPAASVFRYRAGHRWWYFPDMGQDEALAFKLHDSDHGVAWRAPHTAFRDPTAAASGPRESIEVRTMAFFSDPARPHRAPPEASA